MFKLFKKTEPLPIVERTVAFGHSEEITAFYLVCREFCRSYGVTVHYRKDGDEREVFVYSNECDHNFVTRLRAMAYGYCGRWKPTTVGEIRRVENAPENRIRNHLIG